jgi:riboflavin synthase
MFTGLIERKGVVVGASDASLSRPARLWVDVGEGFHAAQGDSVAVNGCCLTVAAQRRNQFAFDVSSETLDCTTFGVALLSGSWPGTNVNLERAMKLGDRLGGHLVSGHVDGTATVLSLEQLSSGWRFCVLVEKPMGRFIIPKGSVCIDGTSLTVNSVIDEENGTVIEMMLIPATLEITNLAQRVAGDQVNIELDMMAKFAARLDETSHWAGKSHQK